MNSRRIAALLGVSLAWIAGCSARPPERSTDWIPAAPPAWSAGEAERRTFEADPSAGRWWESFDDPALSETVELALAENRDLRAAAARIDQARGLARIAGAPLVPAIGAGLNGSRSRQFLPFDVSPAQAGASPAAFDLQPLTTRWGVSLDTSWEVDLWGRLHADARAAVAQLQASDADYVAARHSVAAQTAKLWFASAEAALQADLARRSAESFGSLADQIEDRYRLGVRPSIDLRLARSNATSAGASHAQRQAQLDGTTRQLEILLGRYPSGTLGEETEGLPTLPRLSQPVPAGIPADIVARRPDLVAAERRLLASEEGLASSRRNLYPRLNLTISGGTASDSLGDLLDGDFRVWSLLGGLVQPIFQGGRIRAEIARSEGVRSESAERFAGAVLQAYGEVERGLAAEGFLQTVVEQLERTAHELTAARSLAEERYRSGVGDYLSVLESQTRSFNAESQLLGARRALLENRINLHLALGGGFETAALSAELED